MTQMIYGFLINFNFNQKYMNQLRFNLGDYYDAKSVIKLKRRLKNAQLDSDTNHPILLPKRNNFTELIIRDAH